MTEERLKELLNKLTDATAGPVRPGLDEDIKHQIPQPLMPHRGGWDTISIIIDLRVSKLAAAAVIILTMIFLANFFGGRDFTGTDIYESGKLLIGYIVRGSVQTHRGDVLTGLSNLREALSQQGREVVFCNNNPDPEDIYAVVMYWKLPDGRYGVIFGDLTTKTVTPDTLILLQTQMLQKETK